MEQGQVLTQESSCNLDISLFVRGPSRKGEKSRPYSFFSERDYYKILKKVVGNASCKGVDPEIWVIHFTTVRRFSIGAEREVCLLKRECSERGTGLMIALRESQRQ